MVGTEHMNDYQWTCFVAVITHMLIVIAANITFVNIYIIVINIAVCIYKWMLYALSVLSSLLKVCMCMIVYIIACE